MRVLLLGYLHGHGGIQTHTHFLATGLAERGHMVRVVTPPPISRQGDLGPVERLYRVHTYHSLGDVMRGFRAGAPDIAVVCGTGWKAMLGTLRLPRGTCRVFFEVMSGTRAGRLDPRALVHAGFDAVVGQGEPITRRFCESFGWKGLAVTIPALPEPLERSVAIPERAPLPAGVGPRRFAFFSRLAPHKNATYLVRHWRDYAPPGSHLDIWGTGEDEAAIRTLIAEMGLGKEITLRGRYPHGADYVQLLQSYDLMLLPTIGDEGAPLVLLEAMACGLPFVANGVGGIPDYCNRDVAVTNGRIEDFVPLVRETLARIEHDLIDPARLQNYYMNRFSFDRLVERWETFLVDLGRGTRGSAQS